MKVRFVDLAQRYSPYRSQFHAVLDRVLDHGMAILGPEVGELECLLASHVGCEHVVTVGNGTDALVLALKARGITSGEVITTPMSYLASTSSIVLSGALPVFADVGPDLNLDPAAVEQAIGPDTKAILVVHLGGNPAKMDDFVRIAKAHNIALIEDCAQAFGASIGKPVGSFGDAGAVSFHPLKNLGGIGDGGAIFTNDAEVAAYLRRARNHGHSSRDQCEFWSLNSRLDSLQAGFLSILLADYSAILGARQAQAQIYLSELAGVVKFPSVNLGAQHSYNFFYILAPRRDELMEHLKEKGIDVRIHYPVAIHKLNAAADLGKAALPQAEKYTQEILSLPLGLHLSADQQAFVIQAIRDFYV